MRRILIDIARRKKSLKYGGDRRRNDLDKAVLATDDKASADNLIALDEALEKFARKHKIKAELIKLRYFAGLTIEQAANVLDISHATAERYWDLARSWLRLEIMNSD
jgi:RNA polymerase sigma factor (TIGR02999 family)